MTTKPAKPHGRRYPWRRWFRHSEFYLEEGHHFEVNPYQMANMIRRTASRNHNLFASVTIVPAKKDQPCRLHVKTRPKPKKKGK